MKKIIFTVAAIFAFGFANAQDKKESTGEGFSAGNVMLSGSAGFSSTTRGDVKNNTFNFSPRVGFFVTNNIAVGIALGVEGTKTEDFDGPTFVEQTRTDFSIGAFGRYYFTPASKFSVFAELGFNVVSGKVDTDETLGGTTISYESKVNGFNFGLAPGLSYFISDSWALEAKWGMLSYNTTEPDAPAGFTSESTDTFNLGLDLDDLMLGLVYKF